MIIHGDSTYLRFQDNFSLLTENYLKGKCREILLLAEGWLLSARTVKGGFIPWCETPSPCSHLKENCRDHFLLEETSSLFIEARLKRYFVHKDYSCCLRTFFLLTKENLKEVVHGDSRWYPPLLPWLKNKHKPCLHEIFFSISIVKRVNERVEKNGRGASGGWTFKLARDFFLLCDFDFDSVLIGCSLFPLSQGCRLLKGPKREIFGLGIFAQIRPIWIGYLGTRPKNPKKLRLGPYIALYFPRFLC